jgi:hypothetical protein
MPMPARYLLLAQIGFFASLTVCALIDPAGLSHNHGWSYYEGRSQTLVPYVLGFLGCVLLIASAAALLQRSRAPAGLTTALRLLALFLLLNLATPDTVNAVFYWAHDLTSALLFLYELGFAIWLVRTIATTRLCIGLLVLQFLGGLVAMFSQLQLVSLLGVGILVFQLSFGGILVTATARLCDVMADNLAASSEEVPASAVNR